MDGINYRKGSAEPSWICQWKMPEAVEKDVKAISTPGGTPLVVATGKRAWAPFNSRISSKAVWRPLRAVP